MKFEISTYEKKKYLHVIRPASTRLTEIKASRQGNDRSALWDEIELVLSDCRAVNFETASVLDVDTIATDLKDDIPNCKRVAVIVQPNASNLFNHFKNVCECFDIEVRFFNELEPAEIWLCKD